jgi:hypothetical protein
MIANAVSRAVPARRVPVGPPDKPRKLIDAAIRRASSTGLEVEGVH